MAFSKKIKNKIFVQSARHCCVCHRATGINIEVHHIKPRKQGGEDTLDNAIALCFNCHADAGHYFAGHPKGAKLSPQELIKHKSEWFKIVKENRINAPLDGVVELIIQNKDFKGSFKPIFIKEETRYIDKDSLKYIYELQGKDPMDFVNKLKKDSESYNPFYSHHLKKIKSYDEFMEYLNNDDYELEDVLSNTNCQPITYNLGTFLNTDIEKNLSNCIIDLRLKNTGKEVLENYKLYLTFENVEEVDSVDKQNDALDFHKYNYNIRFIEKFKGEFIPDSDVLVQNDSVLIDSICFRTSHLTKCVNLHWELFARNINTKGKMEFIINPQFEIKDNTKYVDKKNQRKRTIRILPKLDLG